MYCPTLDSNLAIRLALARRTGWRDTVSVPSLGFKRAYSSSCLLALLPLPC